jgi:hypothetical protein
MVERMVERMDKRGGARMPQLPPPDPTHAALPTGSNGGNGTDSEARHEHAAGKDLLDLSELGTALLIPPEAQRWFAARREERAREHDRQAEQCMAEAHALRQRLQADRQSLHVVRQQFAIFCSLRLVTDELRREVQALEDDVTACLHQLESDQRQLGVVIDLAEQHRRAAIALQQLNAREREPGDS